MKSYRALMGMTACAALAAAAYAQPANDDPSAAVDLSASSFPTQTDAVDIFGAVTAPEIAMCVGANSTVWYKLVANSSGTITAKTCAADAPACTTGDTVLAIYESADGSSDTLTQLVCNDDFCGLRSTVSASCTGGMTYFIQAAKYGTIAPTAGTMMQINVTAPNLSEPPMGSGTATPNSVNNCGGAAVLFEVTTIPGTNPVSTGITVTGDLFGIGGLSNQTFYDNGTHGDVSSGDGVFSFSQSVEAGTFAAAYNLPFEVRDSIGRFTNGSIALTVVECPPPPPANDDCSQATDLSAATFPTLTDDADIGGAAPAPEAAYSCGFGNGYTVWYKVTANSTGTMTASTRAADAPGCTVNDTVLAIYESADGTCDTLTSIGCNDDSPYPKSWVQVPVTGGMTYYVQAARYGSTVTPPAPGTFMEVLITAPNTSEPPTGTGTVTPATFNNCDANNATLEVTVTPGTNPASNPANVVADLLSVGGSGSQALYDDGTHGDASAGDNVFTYTFTVAAGTSPAAYTFPFTVNDQANRPTNGTSSALTVTPCPPPPVLQRLLRRRRRHQQRVLPLRHRPRLHLRQSGLA